MLNALARASVSKVTDPVGRGLLRIGLSPDLVTVLGTVGVVAGSVGLLATGYLLAGTIVVTAFVLFDLLDGAMARARGYGTDFGVVLDASCDRIADGALFGALAFYAFVHAGSAPLGVAALVGLVSGQVVSYVKARADSVSLSIGGALAERAERNVLGLVGSGLAGIGVPHALSVCLWVLAAACVITVVQRLVQVRLAYLARPRSAGPDDRRPDAPETAGRVGGERADGPQHGGRTAAAQQTGPESRWQQDTQEPRAQQDAREPHSQHAGREARSPQDTREPHSQHAGREARSPQDTRESHSQPAGQEARSPQAGRDLPSANGGRAPASWETGRTTAPDGSGRTAG
ncbi:MAG TPA: CDP-alcohol phosphatidyltransferase family protein [Nakamurella sp.]|nr:CDP-alcohol phosphatidyltransferase family protein [Nakamurella sp.]